MKNAARALVVGGMTGVTVLMGTGVAMAATATYPPAPPVTTQTAVPAVTPAVTPVAVLGEVVTKPAPTVATPSASLPFTGLDTMALVAVGAALVAGGTAMTVATRRRRGVQH
jgi:disulfide bond formation protein DsbB